jgi:protein phosphatase
VGALAATLAVEAVVGRYVRTVAHRDPRAALAEAVQVANRIVHEVGRAMVPQRDMGTTCTALVLRHEVAFCAHVGDSRVYLARGGVLFHMTEDHSAAMRLVRAGTLRIRDASWYADRRELSRALGGDAEVSVSHWPVAFAVRPRDRFLLCTRGVHERVSEPALLRAMCTGSPSDGCAALITQARSAGVPSPLAVSIVAC